MQISCTAFSAVLKVAAMTQSCSENSKTHRTQRLLSNSTDILGHEVPGASGKEVHCSPNPLSYGSPAICLSSLQGGGGCNFDINAPFAHAP